MIHLILHISAEFTGNLTLLVLISMCAVKAETATRQWPWLVGLVVLSLFVCFLWTAQGLVAETVR